MSRRRVVVTGLGLISPVGIGVEPSWQSLVAGRSGIGPITQFDASTYPTRIAGEVKGFEPGDWMDKKEARRNDRFIQFALAAAEMAVQDSGLDMSKEDPEQVGCIVGAGMGGLGTIEENRTLLTERGLKRISPFFIPSLIINLAPGQISMRYGMKGPNFSTVSACATGNHSIGDALLYIERGLADVMVAGGCEATITAAGRGRLLRGARHVGAERRPGEGQPRRSTRDGTASWPARAPACSSSRSTSTPGSAAPGSTPSWPATAPPPTPTTSPRRRPEGEGGQRAMKMALKFAGMNGDQVGYVNTHGTSTPMGDVAECQAINNRAAFEYLTQFQHALTAQGYPLSRSPIKRWMSAPAASYPPR